MNPGVAPPRRGEGQRDPNLIKGDEYSRHRGPEPGQQQETAGRGRQVLCNDDRLGGRRETADACIDERNRKKAP